MRKCTIYITILVSGVLGLNCSGNSFACRKSVPRESSATSEKERGDKDTHATPDRFQGNASADTSSVSPPNNISNTSASAPWLQTRGNKILHSDGTVFRGRGANIHDTRSCNACTWFEPNVGEVKRRIDELADTWGANFMRLCLESYSSQRNEHQIHWRTFVEDDDYMRDIIEIVEHIGTKPGVYVLVSLWKEPTVNEMGWPTRRTNAVWTKLAKRLLPYPHVMFGIINEPEVNDNGARDAEVWKRMNAAVATIRAIESANGSPQHIIAVQGTRNWARHLGYYIENPIVAGGGTNIVYETHSYLTADQFEENWIKASATLPVVIGEFAPSTMDNNVLMTDADALTLMDEAEQRDIPWLAWTFHMRCGPSLLLDANKQGCGVGMPLVPSPWGKIIMERLKSPWKTE